MAESTTSKPNAPVIENPDQASSNFYWTLETEKGVFNFQTTIRGILTPEQIVAHVSSSVAASKHVTEIGGFAKDLRDKYSSAPAAKLPEPTPVETIVAEVQNADPILQPATQPATQPTASAETFSTEKLVVSISNGKKYFKIKGGQWAKYGVTVWDEVLIAAGIPVGKLEGQEYNLPSYVATFVRKADGKPDKVTKLEKVA